MLKIIFMNVIIGGGGRWKFFKENVVVCKIGQNIHFKMNKQMAIGFHTREGTNFKKIICGLEYTLQPTFQKSKD